MAVGAAAGASVSQLLKLFGITTAVGIGGGAAGSVSGALGSKGVAIGAAGPIGFAGGAGYGLGIRAGFEQIYAMVKAGQLTIADALDLINQVSAGGVPHIGAQFAASTKAGSIASQFPAGHNETLGPNIDTQITGRKDESERKTVRLQESLGFKEQTPNEATIRKEYAALKSSQAAAAKKVIDTTRHAYNTRKQNFDRGNRILKHEVPQLRAAEQSIVAAMRALEERYPYLLN